MVPDAGRDFPSALTEPGNGNEVPHIANLCNAHPRARPRRYITYVATVLRENRAWAVCPSVPTCHTGAGRYIAYLCNAHPRARPKRYIPYVATVLWENRAWAVCPSVPGGRLVGSRWLGEGLVDTSPCDVSTRGWLHLALFPLCSRCSTESGGETQAAVDTAG